MATLIARPHSGSSTTRAQLRAPALRALARFHRLREVLGRRDARARRSAGFRASFYDRVWVDAAAGVGASVTALGDGVYDINRDGRALRVLGDLSPVDDQVTLRVAGNKPLVYRLLAAQGVTVPEHLVFSLASLERARAFQGRLDRDCVVKPALNSSAGRGVTTGIRTMRQLTLAAVAAATRGDLLLIEEELAGDNYRLLFLDGEMIDVIVRRAPGVIGDGTSTLRALVQAENTTRLARPDSAQRLLTDDLDMRNTLAKQGLRLSFVPARGARVVIKTAINQNGSDDNAAAADLVCDAVVEESARAVAAIRARLVGVDVVTPDPGRPLREAGGAIIELNTTPGLHHHHQRGGGGYPVAQAILDRLLSSRATMSPLPHRSPSP